VIGDFFCGSGSYSELGFCEYHVAIRSTFDSMAEAALSIAGLKGGLAQYARPGDEQ